MEPVRSQRLVVPVLIVALGVIAAATLFSVLSWDPRPGTDTSFDLRQNGLWIGHRWYTGVGVRDGEPVQADEVDDLVDTLQRRGIRYVFVHVGPVLEDGSLADEPGEVLGEIARLAPDVVILAWLGARVDRIPLSSAAFRSGLLETIEELRDSGFVGVHFDFEPLHDQHPGYTDTLIAVRERFGPDFILSQATPRAGPFGVSVGPLRGSFWSEAFYRETMALTDQTVVMAYDSQLEFTKGYVAFVRHQTSLTGQWACETPGHELLIGVPSYEDVPIYSNPQIENLHTSSLGVRAALEASPSLTRCVRGVAVYAHWVTDDEEWNQFERHWTSPGGKP
jgi:hypothetical protein